MRASAFARTTITRTCAPVVGAAVVASSIVVAHAFSPNKDFMFASSRLPASFARSFLFMSVSCHSDLMPRHSSSARSMRLCSQLTSSAPVHSLRNSGALGGHSAPFRTRQFRPCLTCSFVTPFNDAAQTFPGSISLSN